MSRSIYISDVCGVCVRAGGGGELRGQEVSLHGERVDPRPHTDGSGEEDEDAAHDRGAQRVPALRPQVPAIRAAPQERAGAPLSVLPVCPLTSAFALAASTRRYWSCSCIAHSALSRSHSHLLTFHSLSSHCLSCLLIVNASFDDKVDFAFIIIGPSLFVKFS